MATDFPEEISPVKNLVNLLKLPKGSVTNLCGTKSDTEKGLESAGDKIKAGAKAVANKIADPDKDLGTECDKEKLKEKVE